MANTGDYVRGLSLTATLSLAAMTLSYFVLSYFSLFTLRSVTITFPIVAFIFLAAQIFNSYLEYFALKETGLIYDAQHKSPHLKVQTTLLVLRIAAAAFLVIAVLFFPALILLGLAATLLVQGISNYSMRRKFVMYVKKFEADEKIPALVKEQLKRSKKYYYSAALQIAVYFVAFAACLLALYPMFGLSGLFSAAIQSKIALSVIGVTGTCFLGLIALKSYDISIYSGSNASASSSSISEQEDFASGYADADADADAEETQVLIQSTSALSSDTISTSSAITTTEPLSEANSSATPSYVSIGDSLSGSKGSRTPSPQYTSPVLSASPPSDSLTTVPELKLPESSYHCSALSSASVYVSSTTFSTALITPQFSDTASATASLLSQVSRDDNEDTESQASQDRDTLGEPYDFVR